jgi:hypothetical protein
MDFCEIGTQHDLPEGQGSGRRQMSRKNAPPERAEEENLGLRLVSIWCHPHYHCHLNVANTAEGDEA